MDEVRRKVYLDLFASPYSLIPLAGGLTSLMAGWAVGGEPTLMVAGIAGVLAGIGVTASRWIWGIEDLTEKAYEYELDKQQKVQEARLDRLDEQLTKDRDPRTQGCLRELRLLYGNLKQAAAQGKISGSSYEVIDGVGKVFDECVKQLEHSHSLWDTMRQLQGPARETMLLQRDKLIEDVVMTVNDVGKMVDGYFVTTSNRSRSELNNVRRELNESIEAARRAEERTAELERSVNLDYQQQNTSNSRRP